MSNECLSFPKADYYISDMHDINVPKLEEVCRDTSTRKFVLVNLR